VRANLTCLFAADGPMNQQGNSDQFGYIPGRYFPCAVRARFAQGGYGHTYIAKLLSIAGENAPPPEKPVLYAFAHGGRDQETGLYAPGTGHLRSSTRDPPCGFQFQKRTAQSFTLSMPPAARLAVSEEFYIERRAEREYKPTPRRPVGRS